MEGIFMPDRSVIFEIFRKEMSQYLDEIDRIARLIATPTSMNEDAGELAVMLSRLGHTIAGVAKTLELSDFAVLGEAIEDTFSHISSVMPSIPRTLTVPLVRMVVYCEARLSIMASKGDLILSSDTDFDHAYQIAENIVHSIPLTRESKTSEEISQAEFTDDQIQTLVTELFEDSPPPSAAAIISAFLSNELRHDNDAFLELHSSQSSVMSQSDDEFSITTETLDSFILELSDGILQMRQDLLEFPSLSDYRNMLRSLNEIAHKLKGPAHMIKLSGIGEITYMLDSLLKLMRSRRLPVDDRSISWMSACVDILEYLQAEVSKNRQEGDCESIIQEIRAEFELLQEQGEKSSPRPPPKDNSSTSSTDKGKDIKSQQPPGPLIGPPNLIRIDINRVDQIVTSLNKMLNNRITLHKLHTQASASSDELGIVINRLTDLFDRLHDEQSELLPNAGETKRNEKRMELPSILVHFLEQHKHDLVHHVGQPELEEYSEYEIIMRMIGEVILDLRALHLTMQTSLSQIGNQEELNGILTETIEKDLIKLRLVPVSALAQKLRWVISQTARSEHKYVEFVTSGEDLEIDRDLSDGIMASLVQLINNAVIHGIESLEERREIGKLDSPQVHFNAQLDGSELVIEISDNGRGINHQRIIGAALFAGYPISAEQVQSMTPEEAFELIYWMDVSTHASEVSPLAGRGLGLPSVRKSVMMLGGKISVRSELEQGTCFTIRLPATLSTMEALFVSMGNNSYAIPLTNIIRTAPVLPTTIEQDEQGRSVICIPDLINQDDEIAIPVISLPILLAHDEPLSSGTSALITRLDNQEYAVLVDTIGSTEEVVVRQVPDYLQQRGVRGATVSKDGVASLILDLHAIIQNAIDMGRFGTPPAIAKPPDTQKGEHLLVVDDSPSIRQGLMVTLQQNGYKVMTARDGLDAVDQMLRVRPRLLILDIEMPQLNGYELLELVHTYSPLQNLPVIMLTSRASLRHRDYAMRLGAIDYLVKPCAPSDLLAAIQHALEYTKQIEL
jgi:chemosensory pili system protein ChpA (sensor histidine kinase/response regulator)